ncbi:MAG TPA: GNAT family N-acetyltransferase [Gammaproteobacteria bacterium]|nr:GNAT family N-acetyltransferase [Gammaproteobacteria bacterium]
MIAEYAKDPELFERCINLINGIFPGCKEFALNGIKYMASWSEGSTPFIIEEQGEIIAHAGVWPITLMLNGKKHHSALIHGVCVKPEHRGKGHFKQLMQEAMRYADHNFDSYLLFTDKPYLYKNYPCKIMLPEYDFMLTQNIKFPSKASDLRILNLDDKKDLNIMHHLLCDRVPLSNDFSIIEAGNTLFILNTLHKKIYYSEILNTIVMFEVKEKTLYITEIISTKQHPLPEIISIFPGTFDKIILQFCPDRFLDEKDYIAKLAVPECCVLTSSQFAFKGKYFRYPELYAC